MNRNKSSKTSRNQIIFDFLKEGSSNSFHRQREHELTLFDLGSSTMRQLLITDDGHRFSPSFSISTQRLAVSHYRKNQDGLDFRPEIILLGLDGEPAARLSSFVSPQNYAKSAVFSPDGNLLAVEWGFEQEYNPDICVLEVLDIGGEWAWDFRKATIANPMQIGMYTPRFSSDGQKLVYLRNYAYEDALEVCLTDLTKSTEPEDEWEEIYGGFYKRRLTHNADVVWRRAAALALEPKSEIAFFIRGHYQHEYEQICAVPCSADAEQDPLATRSITEHFDHIGGIYLSPDGEQFAFNGNGQLYVAALDGGDFLQLSNLSDGKCTCLTFSPDSQYIAYAINKDAKTTGVWLIDRFGKYKKQLLLTIEGGKISELLWV